MHKYVLFDYECKNNTTTKSYAIMFHYYTLYKCIIHNSFIHSFTIVNVVFSDDTPCGVERCLEHAVTSGLV